MDIKLKPVSLPLVTPPNTTLRPASAPLADIGVSGFADEFKKQLRTISAAQNEGSRLQREVQMENPSVSLEETMIAMQKSQIGFQSALHVRNRMVQAYTDIMNMQV
jgi:flagellar hook-basal body complex protein FliE